jgi:molybdate transport system ATP-binding protein
MLYVSHAIDEVLQLTSRMLVLEHGQVIGYGDFVDVMRDTQVLALARSLGMENVMQVELLSHHPAEGYSVARLGAQGLFIPLSAGGVGERITISTAASNVALAREPISGISIQNQLPGTLGQMRQVGHRMLVDVLLDTHTLVAEVSAKSIQDLALSPGMSVHALIKTQALHLYGQAL